MRADRRSGLASPQPWIDFTMLAKPAALSAACFSVVPLETRSRSA
jgi:hypothetical protein